MKIHTSFTEKKVLITRKIPVKLNNFIQDICSYVKQECWVDKLFDDNVGKVVLIGFAARVYAIEIYCSLSKESVKSIIEKHNLEDECSIREVTYISPRSLPYSSLIFWIRERPFLKDSFCEITYGVHR